MAYTLGAFDYDPNEKLEQIPAGEYEFVIQGYELKTKKADFIKHNKDTFYGELKFKLVNKVEGCYDTLNFFLHNYDRVLWVIADFAKKVGVDLNGYELKEKLIPTGTKLADKIEKIKDEDFKRLLDDLVGKHIRATVTVNAKGYATIDQILGEGLKYLNNDQNSELGKGIEIKEDDLPF